MKLAVLLVPVLVLARASAQSPVVPPQGWHSGDTHMHMQFCGSNPPIDELSDTALIDAALGSIRTLMDTTDLNVANILIWANGVNSPYTHSQVFDNLRWLVDGGSLIPGFSDPAAERLLVYGIETSGLSVSEHGHLIALRVGDVCDPNDPSDTCPSTDLLMAGDSDCVSNPCPAPYTLPAGHALTNDGSGDLPVDAINYLRAHNGPEAVFGYAHQHWTTDYVGGPGDVHNQVAGLFDWQLLPPVYRPQELHCLTSSSVMRIPYQEVGAFGYVGRPITLPMDVLFRRVDFLESFDVYEPDPATERRWYGAWYKLLNAGQRVSISGGTDHSCRGNSDQPRTYVLLEDPAAPLTYDAWVDGLVAGRTSIADDEKWFLELKLGDNLEHPIGSQIDVSSASGPASIRVRAELFAGPGVATGGEYVQIVVNGDTVACSDLGELVLDITLDVTESCWIAARQGVTVGGSCIPDCKWSHTGAAYVLLDNRPIAVCQDAEYWAIYMDIIRGRLDPGEMVCPPPVAGLGCRILEHDCCATVDYLSEDAEDARDVFRRIARYAYQDVEPGVVRLGRSTYGPIGPIALGIWSYSSNQRSMFCFNGPAKTSGVLRYSKTLLATPEDHDGAEVFVSDEFTYTFETDEAGSADLSTSVPWTAFGKDLYYQCVWSIPGPDDDNDVASDVLKVPGKKPL